MDEVTAFFIDLVLPPFQGTREQQLALIQKDLEETWEDWCAECERIDRQRIASLN